MSRRDSFSAVERNKHELRGRRGAQRVVGIQLFQLTSLTRDPHPDLVNTRKKEHMLMHT